jgi:hypothetical protein
MTYPKSLFRLGGPEIIDGRHYERVIVNNANEEQVRLAQNWFPLPGPQVDAEPASVKPEAKPKAKAKKKSK